MKFNSFTKTFAGAAVALLVAGCGGGDGDVAAPAAPVASLQVSGTAATGRALAGAAVQVKCATGDGTATTGSSGVYDVTIADGVLPCIIQVTGSVDNAQVTMHSVTEAGSTDAASGRTSAVANVTPLTELVVAQLASAVPSAVFASFGQSSAAVITTDKLAAATTAVLSTLKTATGVDVTSVDPFKAPLVAATSATSTGNAHDQLLDALDIQPQALPQLVTQVATAAASGSTAGLQDAMAAVDAGTLPGCPAMPGGKYRVLEYFGASYVRNLDFKAMTISRPDGTGTLPITVDATKPCEFKVAGNTGTTEVQLDFTMGTAGVGAFRIQNITAGRSNIAYLFPVQAHTLPELVGEWTFHQGGFMPGEGFRHMAGKVGIAADGAVSVCDYNLTTNPWTTCTSDTGAAGLTAAARTDGGYNLNEGSSTVASFWGYRAPNGTLTVFGTTNEAGSTAGTDEQTTLVLSKFSTQPLLAVGTVTKYWDVALVRQVGAGVGQNITSVVADTSTVLSVDAAAGTVTSKRTSDGREATVKYNVPLPGLRHRPLQTFNGSSVSEVYQFPIPGAGLLLSINAVPAASTHVYNVSVFRP
jgi:hypothetical protein